MGVKLEMGFFQTTFFGLLLVGAAYLGDSCNVASWPSRVVRRDYTGSVNANRVRINARKVYDAGQPRWQSFYTLDRLEYRILSDGFPEIPPALLLERPEVLFGIQQAAEARAMDRWKQLEPVLRTELERKVTEEVCAQYCTSGLSGQKREEKEDWWKRIFSPAPRSTAP